MISSISTKPLPTHTRPPRFFYLVTDTAGLYLTANDFFNSSFNTGSQLSPTEWFSKNLLPGYEDQYMAAINACVQKRSMISTELPFRIAGNDECIIYWEVSFMQGEGIKEEHLQWTGMILEEQKPTAISAIETNGTTPERYNAYEYSAEGLWRVDIELPVRVSLSAEEIIEHCRQHGFLAECNDNMARMYGFTRAAELIGSRIAEFLDFDRLETWKLFIKNGFHSSNIETKEFDRHGNTLYFLNNMTGIVENGLLLRVWGTQQDITEKKKAADQIRQSELFFRALIADSLDGILLVDESGTISFSSESVAKILGYETEELIGKNCFAYVHLDDRELGISTFQDEIRQAPQKKFIGIRLRQKSGEWLWCMVRGHNLLSNPAVGKMLIYFCDDTFRRNAETALIESRERFYHLIQNLSVGVVLCNAEGCILLCNQTCLEIFKVAREEDLVGNSVFNPSFNLIYENGKHMPADRYPAAMAMKTKQAIRDQVVGIKRQESGSFTWLQINAHPVLEADQTIKHIICSFADITEQRSLAKQLKQQEQQKQKQLMQATIDGQERERSDISRELHDNISQHVTTTRLYLEVAKDKTEGQPLEMIEQAHKGLMYISTEIRRISQSLAPPELRNIGLVESIRDLCDLLKKIHAFRIDFEHDKFREDKIPDNMKLMLFRIIQEQINNIIRHAHANTIHISLRSSQEEAKLSVADNGQGFDPLLIKKGLGLTNIINRVELFDGNVEIITSPGTGCLLKVRAPLK